LCVKFGCRLSGRRLAPIKCSFPASSSSSLSAAAAAASRWATAPSSRVYSARRGSSRRYSSDRQLTQPTTSITTQHHRSTAKSLSTAPDTSSQQPVDRDHSRAADSIKSRDAEVGSSDTEADTSRGESEMVVTSSVATQTEKRVRTPTRRTVITTDAFTQTLNMTDAHTQTDTDRRSDTDSVTGKHIINDTDDPSSRPSSDHPDAIDDDNDKGADQSRDTADQLDNALTNNDHHYQQPRAVRPWTV